MNLGTSFTFDGLNFRMHLESTSKMPFIGVVWPVQRDVENRIGRMMVLPIIMGIVLNELR